MSHTSLRLADRRPPARLTDLRLTNPSGMREPETACCPTQATICEMLILEPLEPHTAMISGELNRCESSLKHCELSNGGEEEAGRQGKGREGKSGAHARRGCVFCLYACMRKGMTLCVQSKRSEK